MKTRDEIEMMLNELLCDERLSYPPALVQVNAPLALIQVSLKAKVDVLKWILDKE